MMLDDVNLLESWRVTSKVVITLSRDKDNHVKYTNEGEYETVNRYSTA